jgi:hypothetical protein
LRTEFVRAEAGYRTDGYRTDVGRNPVMRHISKKVQRHITINVPGQMCVGV